MLRPATPAPASHDGLLTTREAAEFLRVSERTLYALVRSGRLACIRPTAWAKRFDRRDLQAFIDAARQGGDA